WPHEASAVLLTQLVAPGDVTLLATLRTDEPAPAPVTVLWKDGLVQRIDVAPLGDESVRDLLEAVLDGPVETLNATRLWRRWCGRRPARPPPARGRSRRAGGDAHRDATVAALCRQRAVPPGAPRRSGPPRSAPASRRAVVCRQPAAWISSFGRAGGRTVRFSRRARAGGARGHRRRRADRVGGGR